jgi:hypothetical protein
LKRSIGARAIRAASMLLLMNSGHIVSIIAVATVLIAGCGSSSGGSYGSSSGDGYGNSGGSGSYGSSAASSGSSSNYGSDLGSDIHSVEHADKEGERIKRAQKTEPLLDASGFKSMPIDTPAKQKVIGGLTPLSFNQLAHHGKIRYWFADPYYCKCVYVGDGVAYARYKEAKKQRKAEHVEEANLIDQENMVDLPMDSEWDPVSAFGMP